MSEFTEANEDTDPASFSGMKKSIVKANETADSALSWAMKTYDIVTRIERRVSREESAKTMATVLISVGASLLTSAVVVSCSLVAR